ncbi:ORF6N domain-containing protein [Pedobacter gandavensis]|uniref:ORF6N domain-containing protein n=1 Tax=Pedobacter gandavensis TaxID=2679963 RepID=UPI00292D292C|nr:ORF6N domain-containing protein [Pedobacter gandavensis]
MRRDISVLPVKSCCSGQLTKDIHSQWKFIVETKVLKQAVRRNITGFPDDFMFEITRKELESLRSQFVTSKKNKPYLYLLGIKTE